MMVAIARTAKVPFSEVESCVRIPAPLYRVQEARPVDSSTNGMPNKRSRKRRPKTRPPSQDAPEELKSGLRHIKERRAPRSGGPKARRDLARVVRAVEIEQHPFWEELGVYRARMGRVAEAHPAILAVPVIELLTTV